MAISPTTDGAQVTLKKGESIELLSKPYYQRLMNKTSFINKCCLGNNVYICEMKAANYHYMAVFIIPNTDSLLEPC